MKTPLKFNSEQQIDCDAFPTADKILVDSINRNIQGFYLAGKVYQTTNFIAIICMSRVYNGIPILVTFDRMGNKIDNLFMFPTAGIYQGYHSTDYITLMENRELYLTDSTLTRSLVKNEMNAGETDSLTITTRKFWITDTGEIKEIWEPMESRKPN